MSRDWRWFLLDMVEACEHIAEHVDGLTKQQFCQQRMVQAAVERELAILGEAAKQVPLQVQARAQDVPWRAMARMRDLLNHVYFAVDSAVVWRVATEDVPLALAGLRTLVVAEVGAGGLDDSQ